MPLKNGTVHFDFNIEAKFDMRDSWLLIQFRVLFSRHEMMRRKQFISFDWDKYDQAYTVFKPAGCRLLDIVVDI
ncbi:MAG: hypothetical protein ACXWAT_10205 [Methylobacter sp.]